MTRHGQTTAVALVGLAFYFASVVSPVTGTVTTPITSPAIKSEADWKNENDWYSHVEAEAKAGRGRAQVPALIVLIDGTDSHMREMAAQLLSVIGKDAVEAVPSLIRHINDPDFWPRLRCIEALGDIGPAAADAVPDLIAVLDDPEWSIVNMAAGSLGAMGPKAQQAVPKLNATILQRPKNSEYCATVIVTCRSALAHITGKPGLQVMALLSMLKEKDDDENYSLPALEATRGLGELMPASKIAWPQIGAELVNLSIKSNTRATAAVDLGVFGDPQAVPFLQKAIRDDPDVSVRGAAIGALGKILGPKVDTGRLYRESSAREARRVALQTFWYRLSHPLLK